MAAFFFTNETVKDEVLTDVQAINTLFPDVEKLGAFVEVLIGFLQRPQTDLAAELAAFAGQDMKVQHAKNVARGLLFVFKGALRNNLTAQRLHQDLVKLGLDEDKSIAIGKKWQAHFLALSRAAVGQTFSINQLVDMDWKFGVTASSSESSQVGATFIQLRLVLDKGNSERENVFMELSLPQFYQFLHEMEKAKANLDLF